MRIERSITTVSWIPSDLLAGSGRLAARLGVAHHDQPPPDTLGPDIPTGIVELLRSDGCRFVNHLRAFIDVNDGTISDAGLIGGGAVGSTTLDLGLGSFTVPAMALPELRPQPEYGDGWVRFAQTVGGRTGVPIPRRVSRAPFVQIHAPIVWTTLELTIRADGTHDATMTSASPFPRHWLYGDDGKLVAKSSLADYHTWSHSSFGTATPWGEHDGTALLTAVETVLERELATTIMRGEDKRKLRRIKAGSTVVEQGTPGNEAFLVLNGVLVVEVDGEPLAEVGPGAVVGERAALEHGLRTSTLRARTDALVAAIDVTTLDRAKLVELADGHRREVLDR